ncbi:peptidyl-prolyl cis-trans isomerase-like 4 [Uloborus diversus]|uniref:peptidyl-prolyl cis-trans isomerase-like 4 n=1 Tax=Uloborus diversus TaxID=327109 RepID=UPI00240A6809|nr:peptidyl-prolyl cis-trans isomerase-like 4 [Uloborus diversus]
MSVVIETTVGDITVDLYLKERPNTCLNFLKLCKIKYYNMCLFHKVERNFIAQSGDPTGTGRGGGSIFSHLYGDQATYFDIEKKPRLKHEKRGTLSMVNNGNSMIGSQFFITLGENLTYLDDDHSVFGEVAEGFDILLKLNEAICDDSNRPYQDIRITHTVVLHDPFDDPTDLVIPDASPEPTKEQLESNYIGANEEIDDTKGKSMEEIEEKIKESEAKARATILEMVGDLPDADVKPPENVLFVCKLNPVTTSEDLEVIFSRFGQILSCEVIKDKKSGESLQYAFIEFEKEEDCENAYFKMDNVLIDDRRIHVDFSQSVSKLNWEAGAKFNKSRSGRSENLVIKSQTKKPDGYDMVFDIDNDEVEPSREKRGKKRKSTSPDGSARKSSNYYKDKTQSKHRNRSRSPIPKDRQSYKQSKFRSISPEYPERRRERSSEKNYSENRREKSGKYYSSNQGQRRERSPDRNYSRLPQRERSAERKYPEDSERTRQKSSEKYYSRTSEKRNERYAERNYSRSPDKSKKSLDKHREFSDRRRDKTKYSYDNRSRSRSPHPRRRNSVSRKEKREDSRTSKHSSKAVDRSDYNYSKHSRKERKHRDRSPS